VFENEDVPLEDQMRKPRGERCGGLLRPDEKNWKMKQSMAQQAMSAIGFESVLVEGL
jgi:hypothetical protein